MAIRVTRLALLDQALVLGAPGVGKSEVVRERAREEAIREGRVFLDLAVEARGSSLEDIVERVSKQPSLYHVYYEAPASILLAEYLEAIRRGGVSPLSIFAIPGVAGTLVIDRVTSGLSREALEAVASLLGEKRLGHLTLSSGVRVVALGYPPEYGGVPGLPSFLVSRVVVLRVEPPSLEEWYWYMLERFSGEMPEHFASILSRARRAIERGGSELGEDVFLQRSVPDESLENFPTPRSWSRLVVTLTRLYERVREGEMSLEEYRVLASEAIRGLLGERVAPVVEKYLVGGMITSDALIELFRRGRSGLRELLQEAAERDTDVLDDILEAVHGLDTLYAYRVLREAREAIDGVVSLARGEMGVEEAARRVERFLRSIDQIRRDARNLLEFIASNASLGGADSLVEAALEVDERLRRVAGMVAGRVERWVDEARRLASQAGGEGEEASRLLEELWEGFNRVALLPYPPLRMVLGLESRMGRGEQ